MEIELKPLKHKRGLLKSQLTKFKTFFDANQDKPSQLKVRFKNIENLLAEFDEVQTKIELLIEDENHETERESFENSYYEIISEVKDFLSNIEKEQSSSVSDQFLGQQQTIDQARLNHQEVQVKLPTINLPTFSGSYDEWQSFSESFQSLIHDNRSLSDVHKFYYLKSCLKGKAVDILMGLEASASNYTIAWSLLKDRFENMRLITYSYVSALFSYPSIDKENAFTIRSFLDHLNKNIRALKALGQPTDQWDTIIIHLIVSKLPSTSVVEWEKTCKPKVLPTLCEMLSFLENRYQSLQTIETKFKPSFHKTNFERESDKPACKPTPFKFNSNKTLNRSTFVSTDCSTELCNLCKGEHKIFTCDTFLKLTIKDRIEKVRSLGLCLNCLKDDGHKAFQCKARNCKLCNRKHNTLLHLRNEPSSLVVNTELSSRPSNQIKSKKDNTSVWTSNNSISNDTHSAHSVTSSGHVLLPTAIINVEDNQGNLFPCRVLLDSASQCNFISEHMTQILHLKKEKVFSSVTGISQTTMSFSKLVHANIRSRVTSYSSSLDFIVLSRITVDLPSVPIDVRNWQLPPHIELADPNCHMPNRIDMLLGAEIFMDLLCLEESKKEGSHPTLTKTKLGWVVSGRSLVEKTHNKKIENKLCHFITANTNLDKQLQRFWQLEEVDACNQLSAEDLFCEKHYTNTIKRDSSGRYTVSMPFKENPNSLGESCDLAKKRFEQIEKRFNRQPNFKSEYSKFIDEYHALGHMEEVIELDDKDESSYFIPHHAVFKESSTTTKLRVVFDCSAKTSNGISLNDILLTGPCIQQDLFSIMSRFRTHNYVLNADIEKMYRQIEIDSTQRNLLKIFWRNEPLEQLKTYRLKTVTYGSACAPFLATRTLHQLAIDERNNFPLASTVLTRDFYMDDLLTGCNSFEDAQKLQEELMSLLQKGGFKLRKWTSNSMDLIANLSKEDIEFKGDCSSEISIKTLGLLWNPANDKFHFSNKTHIIPQFITKRSILSEIAQIFDPLGLISPIVVQAKMFMQKLWKYNLQWDEPLPEVERDFWKAFTDKLIDINHIEISRRVLTFDQSKGIQLHGFCDSSERAYGACLYIRQEDNDGNISARLLCSKSKVAPVKNVTLPRLELCAALLLSRLISKVLKTINIAFESCILWTDSTIVLSWLNSPSSRWKTFVANRVAEIQELTKAFDWQHVRSQENPADIVSRGMNPIELKKSNLWWNGPEWLNKYSSFESCYEHTFEEETSLEERKFTATTIIEESFIDHLSKKYSSFTKLQRVIAFCLRFIHKTRKSINKFDGPLSVSELQQSHRILIKLVQQQELKEEVKVLQDGNPIYRKSKLRFLHPFLDKDSIIRVGGRLQHSSLDFDHKHPIVLPNHRISKLIVENIHKVHLHIGPQQLLAVVRQQYWPINGRNLVRKLCRECITCFKANPKPSYQEMGALPKQRVEPNRAFVHTGVDYCGPIYIRSKSGRGGTSIKTYIAIFVCLAVKAVHIELVQDLTSEAFIAALKRFMARRGKVAHMYSDNATNFVGANNELKELKELFEQENLETRLEEEFAASNIEWHFNPPNSPHFGGLWEAAVKSTKYHIKRIAANSLFTYDEMYTLLTQIEACLNSRPITPISDDPNDLSYLTPGHFLIGDSLTANLEPDLTPVKLNRLSRWQRVQQMFNHFWKRWSNEYLSSLQTRNKWIKESENLRVGDLVILQDNNLPPLKWKIGRIVDTFPGKDNKVRVISVKTSKGVFRRAVASVCPLPKRDI